MSVLIIDGPEKAGKTTFARQLVAADPTIRYRHWGPVKEYDDYYEPLVADVAKPYVVVWDRGWASESVYSTLLNRGRALQQYPFYGEWLFGRAVMTNGARVVLAPPAALLEERRTKDDLPIDPAIERAAFVEYADKWGWQVFTQIGEGTVAGVVRVLRRKLDPALAGMVVPRWVGPRDARVAFVGEARNRAATWPDVPFSSPNPAELGASLGPLAMLCGWTNADECDPAWLTGKKVVGCGSVASKWLTSEGVAHVAIPHPSWLYRWKAGRQQVLTVEAEIRRIVAKAYGKKKEARDVHVHAENRPGGFPPPPDHDPR